MSLPSMGISGNTGLKDQQMALEWVFENIASFNGNQNNICLFGESAGAACTHLHVMNPKSRRFIKSAICQSGSGFASQSFRGNTNRDVRTVAELLGCKSDKIEDIFENLVRAPVKDLYENSEKNPSVNEQTHRFRRWRLVIEEESEDAFITQTTIESMISQKGQIDLPIILGVNDGDGMPKVAENLKRLKEVNDNMDRCIPKNFAISPGERKSLGQEIKRFYFGDRDVSEETLGLLKTVFSDIIYLMYNTICTEFTAQYQPKCKQFLYEFQFDGKLNLQKKQVKLERLPGACHADDLFYIFGGTLADQVELTEDSREWKMRKLICKLWTNFAKFHDPTPDDDNTLPFKWNPITPLTKTVEEIELEYLVLNDDVRMVKNLHKDRMDFWREAYRKVNRHSFTSKSKL